MIQERNTQWAKQVLEERLALLPVYKEYASLPIKAVRILLGEINRYPPLEEIERLQKRDHFLNLLECAGVDNWDGYGEAQGMQDEEEE